MAQVVSVLARGSLGELSWGIKGLPLCTLVDLPVADLADRVWRTGNRLYVDADHQRSEALLFQPDLVRFVKVDACRFCAVQARCDGVASSWLERGLVGPLTPVDPVEEG